MSHTGTCDHSPAAHDEPSTVVHTADRLPVFEKGPSGADALADPCRGQGRTVTGRLWALLTLGEVRWAALATILFALAIGAGAVGAPGWLSGLLFAGCFASGGWEPARTGLRELRARRLDVDLLMIAAGLGAAAIGQVVDGALLIVIFASSGALEAVATRRTRDSVRSLLTLAPDRATRRSAGGEETVDAARLAIGDLVVVRPGERIAADGHVVEGASEVDQATITGEALPVLRKAGDEVFAGTLNRNGVLVVRVSRAATESVMARIVAMVEQASATKANAQLFIEKVEQRYSVGVVVATLGLFLVPLALGASLQSTLLRAMTFMIVASPCAVVLATMPPLLAAIANAGHHGVLVKSSVVMEQFATVTVVAFDKTGTLTEGTPRVTEVLPVPGAGLDGDTVLGLAAAAENASEHPLGRAIVSAAVERSLTVGAALDFSSAPGLGVRAVVRGRTVEVGNPALFDGKPCGAEARLLIAQLEREGRTAVVVMVDGAVAGVLGLADRLRPGAREVVDALARLSGRTPLLLTGDNAGAACRLAEEVGITEVHAGLLPQDKVRVVHRLQAEGERVLVVGDGVNDAPALASAHLGVAMGRQGSDLALETADAVVVRDDLTTLPAVIALSRRARRTVAQNLAFAGTAIVVLVTLDLFGNLPLSLGVAGHEGSTVAVGLNGLRLLRGSAWGLSHRA